MAVNIIYIIVAILFVLRLVNRNRQNAERNEKENNTGNKSKSLFESYRPDPVAQNQKTSSVRVNERKKTKKDRSKSNKGNMHTFASLAAADTPDEPRAGESMTDYLARKAHEDDVVRKKEEWEERREEQRSAGSLRIANRLVFGERPPRGSLVKKCPYCGAENLVPQMSREKYHCYFCRSSLK
jgi:hypothetical protein